MSNSPTNVSCYIAKDKSPNNFKEHYKQSNYRQACRITPLPMQPRTIKLFFSSKEITKFLDNYNCITTNSMLADKQKVCYLPNFCNNSCCCFVKQLKPY